MPVSVIRRGARATRATGNQEENQPTNQVVASGVGRSKVKSLHRPRSRLAWHRVAVGMQGQTDTKTIAVADPVVRPSLMLTATTSAASEAVAVGVLRTRTKKVERGLASTPGAGLNRDLSL
jgi:hypothetical protein